MYVCMYVLPHLMNYECHLTFLQQYDTTDIINVSWKPATVSHRDHSIVDNVGKDFLLESFNIFAILIYHYSMYFYTKYGV